MMAWKGQDALRSLSGEGSRNRSVLSRSVPAKLLRLSGFFVSAATVVLLWALRQPAGGLPRRELLFGLLVYVLGPGGLTVAAASLVSGRPGWMVVLTVATYIVGLALFLVYAVNVRAISL